MNNTQRVLLSVYLPITLLILFLDDAFPNVNMVWYLKYTVIVTLFLAAFSIKKRYREQKLMTLSLFFVVIADFFLVFSLTLIDIKINLMPFGIAGFFFAYICLIFAYEKNFKMGRAEILTAIPIAVTFLLVFLSLQPYIKGLMIIGALFFEAVLCYMLWTSVCTIFRKYYKSKITFLIAVSSLFMFICDIGVAYGLFYPNYSDRLYTVVKNVVWLVYIMGWTLLTVIISEEEPLRSE